MNMNIGESASTFPNKDTSSKVSPKQPNNKKKRGGATKDVTLITNDLFENIGSSGKVDLNVIKN